MAELEKLLQETGARAVLFNRRWEPALMARDTAIKRRLLLAHPEIEVLDYVRSHLCSMLRMLASLSNSSSQSMISRATVDFRTAFCFGSQRTFQPRTHQV
eukprot:SAG31_NODE_28632_length_407_cov_0.902597_1_plen_99_part_01